MKFISSIRTKIFLYIFLAFGLILLFVIYSPRYFFNEYYTYQKIYTLADQVDNFSERYLGKNLSPLLIYDAMENFNRENDAYIKIISDDLLDTYSTNYRIQVTTIADNVYDIYLSDELLYDSKAAFMDLSYGDDVTISGYWLDDKTLCPRVVNNQIVGNEFYTVNSDLFIADNYHAITGKITTRNYPDRNSGELYKSNIAWKIIREDIEYSYIRNDYQLYRFEDTETGIVNYMIRKAYTPYDIIAIISLQENTDIDQSISNYMQLAIIIGVIAIIIFSLVLSRLISKPLTYINESARRIANLDFSQKIPVTSKDELGLLSTHLNKLSTELERTITDLNDANNELKVKLWRQKELEDMRKQFIADVSHEVKTPLGIIQGYAERVVMQLLEAKENKEYVIDCASIIIEEAKKMDNLITNMNELSRLESPAYSLTKSHFELRQLVNDTLEAFDVFLDEKNYKINRNFDDLKCYIYGDKAKLEQVLINFLSNVIRYTPEDGEVNITVTHKKSKIYFAIENEADEINEMQINQLWERFFRLDKSRSRAHGGSGIGLSIVKVILELHEYEFGVEKTDIGIRFFFYAH